MNDFISALPPNGIHRSLHKGTSTGQNGKKRKKDAEEVELSRDQITSLSIQNYYWMALSEWVLGFVSPDTLERDLYWESCDASAFDLLESNSKSNKCTVPPEMMTILMKQCLPEWIDTINNYVYQQHQQNQQLIKTKQQQKQQRKKQGSLSKEEQQMQSKVQQQQLEKHQRHQNRWEKQRRRDGVLLTCAIQNLRTMCFVSIGTAREVLRRLSMAGSAASTKSSATVGNTKSRGKPSDAKGVLLDGTNWMAQLLQQKPPSIETSSSSTYCNPQVECLHLVCTLLETKDYTILSRMCQAPSCTLKQGNRSGKADSFGLLYVALRYGMQYLLDSLKNEEETAWHNGQIKSFALSIGRLLRDVKLMLLPPSDKKVNERNEGFILGASSTVSSSRMILSIDNLC
jgi:hypothetical protein